MTTFNLSAVKMLIPLILLLLAAGGCRQTLQQTTMQERSESRYFDEVSDFNRSFQLEEISRNVKKLFCIVEYDIYHFDETSDITADNLEGANLRRRSLARSSFSETVFGTATILQNNRNGLLLITSAHIVSNPDTIVSFFPGSEVRQRIESIAIKRSQMNFIREAPGNNLVRIVAIDLNRDIAFLSDRFSGQHAELPELDIAIGDASHLRWSTPVYLMGFPGGQQMVTRSVVGNPNPSVSGDFVVDATFNPGGSGSLALVLNQDTQLFELVGIVKATAATYSNVLRPEKDSRQKIYNPNVPYTGEVYAHRVREIYHGVTFAVSINTIRDFYFEARRQITREGFNLDAFFGL